MKILFSSGVLFTVAMVMSLSFIQCGYQSPTVNDSGWQEPKFDHANFSTSCSPCHEGLRPAPVNVTVHGNGQDCVVCHKFTTDATWLSHLQYSHIPTPTSCLSCHGSLRPKPPHNQTGDCKNCHTFPKW